MLGSVLKNLEKIQAFAATANNPKFAQAVLDFAHHLTTAQQSCLLMNRVKMYQDELSVNDVICIDKVVVGYQYMKDDLRDMNVDDDLKNALIRALELRLQDIFKTPVFVAAAFGNPLQLVRLKAISDHAVNGLENWEGLKSQVIKLNEEMREKENKRKIDKTPAAAVAPATMILLTEQQQQGLLPELYSERDKKYGLKSVDRKAPSLFSKDVVNFVKKLDEYISACFDQQEQMTAVDCSTFWRRKAAIYPEMAWLMRKVLGVMPTQVQCERAFSTAGWVVSARRNRLAPSVVNHIVQILQNCYRLKTYLSDDELRLIKDLEKKLGDNYDNLQKMKQQQSNIINNNSTAAAAVVEVHDN
jgi:hypothetical protein